MTVQIFAILLAIIVLVTVLLLVRSYVMPEKYAIVWMLAGLFTLVFAIFPQLLTWLATVVGVADPLNLLFLASLIFILLIVMQLSLDLAKTRRQLREAVQALSLDRIERDKKFKDR